MRVTLTVIAGPHRGQSFAFQNHDNFLVGRGAQAHFRLPKKDPYFSRLHFMVEVNPPHCRLLDLGSANGTNVNRLPVEKPTDLSDGDLIEAGDTVMQVSIESQRSSPEARDDGGSSSTLQTVQSRAVLPRVSQSTHRRAVSEVASANTDLSDLPTCVQLPKSDTNDSTKLGLPPDYEDLITRHPQPFPGYRLVDELGRGGMGVVYRAVSETTQSVVALKSVKPAAVGSSSDVARFLREAAILSQLQHRHIVRFLDQGEANGQFFFAMEYVLGVDAARLQKQVNQPLSVSRVIKLGCQMLDALDYAHRLGFVHRDVKPANLLITQQEGREVLKLTDFGLSRTYQATPMSKLTLTGDFAGTTAFMPPEQITNFRDSRPAVDQYSAAATLYTLLTGQGVYDLPKTVSGQILMIMQSDPIPILSRRNDLPRQLAETLHRALARNPADRFPDVAAFRDELIASVL